MNIYSEDAAVNGTPSLGTANIVYVSIPDPLATSTAGDQCQGLSLLSLPTGYSYRCASPSYYRLVNSTGWIPVNFSSISVGSPIGQLPQDPTNASSSRLYYTYTTNGSQYELTAAMESAKYQLGGPSDVVSTDGGTDAYLYEKGTNLALAPVDYGLSSGLVDYWPLDEGTGTVAYDWSGSNATGTWNGNASGTSGYYSAGKPEGWAGSFDGSTDYVSVPNVNQYNFSNTTFTVVAWINTTSSAGGFISSVSANSGGWGVAVSLFGTTGTLTVVLKDSSNNQSMTANTNQLVDTGLWTQVVAVITTNTSNANGNSATFYINGSLASSTTAYGSNPYSPYGGYPLAIGKRNSSNNFSGLIDDVRIYSRALSATEVAALYNGGK